VSGTVEPAVEGSSVILQKRKGGDWLNVRSGTTAEDGSFHLSSRFASSGTYLVRVVAPADAQHAAGVGPLMSVSVA
jgi:hypothetical protein